MLEAYVAAGFDPSDFWALTLRLYQIHMRGASARIRREQDQAKSMAWLTAALGRASKMPKLDKIVQQEAEVIDVDFRLRAVRSRLPSITMAEWSARQG